MNFHLRFILVRQLTFFWKQQSKGDGGNKGRDKSDKELQWLEKELLKVEREKQRLERDKEKFLERQARYGTAWRDGEEIRSSSKLRY